MDVQAALQQRARVEEFQRRHRVGLLTLLFTDLVGSTKLKQELGDQEAVTLIQRHHALVREILSRFEEGEEIGTAGDSFFIVFTKPSDAVQFSLLLQNRLRTPASQSSRRLQDRVGIHIGEVVVEERPDSGKPKDLYGLQVDICARVMSLAEGDQILLTRSAFDNARQVLKGQEIERTRGLIWLNHGPYSLKGVEEPLEICEVGEIGEAVLKPPPDSEKVYRYVSPDIEPVLGWRPAIGQQVPNTQWELEEKLGEGGFGEVWLGRHLASKERRVFKFCFRSDRVRSLKREVTLFKLLKERFGQHPNIVAVYDVYFDQPPFYLEVEYVPGRDLRRWIDERGGVGAIPLEERLEIVAQVADALQAAHEAGVIHRDVKPGNVLIAECGMRSADSRIPQSAPRNSKSAISQPSTLNPQLSVKLTDFGIGQVVSEEILAGVTGGGFTETLVSARSSSGTGTYLYLAPELISGQRASTRSDIYSLGVVLYQLLVGDLSRPITSDWQEKIADPLLLDDLKRCLAGEPGRRFREARQLAENLRSLERRRAALAKPQQADLAPDERAEYRLRKFRAASWAAAAVILALLISAAAITWQAVRAIRVEKEAQLESSRSRQTANFLDDMVRSVQAAVALGADPAKLRVVVDTAAERVGQEFRNHPRGEAEIRTTIGSAYRELGEYAKAEANYRTALALTKKHLGNTHPNTAALQSNLVGVLQAGSGLPAAAVMHPETRYEQGDDRSEEIRRLPGSEAIHPETRWQLMMRSGARGDLTGIEATRRMPSSTAQSTRVGVVAEGNRTPALRQASSLQKTEIQAGVGEPLKAGNHAPNFELPGSDGKTHRLSDFRGKKGVVVAWFPNAFFRLDTEECKSIRESGSEIRKFDVAHFAASCDPLEGERGNKSFAQSLAADYPILSDSSGETAKAYGVFNAERRVAMRWTFFIAKDGKILHLDNAVNPVSHGADIVAKLRELGVAASVNDSQTQLLAPRVVPEAEVVQSTPASEARSTRTGIVDEGIRALALSQAKEPTNTEVRPAAEAPAKFRVGEFNFARPAGWEWVEVAPGMRKAQLKVVDQKSKGTADVVFFSGPMGPVQANVDRWFSQFQEPREKINAKTAEVTVGKHKITYASAQGTYQSGMPGGAKTAMKDHALLGAIIVSPQGDVFVRMTGPAELVKASTADLKKMMEGALK